MTEAVTTKHTASPCRGCGTVLDASTDPEGGRRPEAGDVTVCIVCSTVSVYTEGLDLREPTDFVLSGTWV